MRSREIFTECNIGGFANVFTVCPDVIVFSVLPPHTLSLSLSWKNEILISSIFNIKIHHYVRESNLILSLVAKFTCRPCALIMNMTLAGSGALEALPLDDTASVRLVLSSIRCNSPRGEHDIPFHDYAGEWVLYR